MLNQAPLRVLIAEDDAAIHEEIKALIRSLGFIVVGDAYNGPQAVSLAEQLKPDVTLLDIVMPDPDSGREDKQAGIHATKAILENQPMPIVWLTAYETPQMIAEASKLGVSAYLVKPPQANQLARAIAMTHARFADTQELRRLNAALQQALADKDMLMRELQHRVKNSLTIAASMIMLEEPNLTDERARAVFASVEARIYSMSAVYEQLYRGGGIDHIDLAQYIRQLAAGLSRSYVSQSGPVKIETQVDEIQFDLKRALPLGIILTELITNALKYAFPPGVTTPEKPGTILVELSQADGQASLRVVDNGVGIPDGKLRSGSMGLELVNMLAQQIGGSFELESREGCAARVSFRIETNGYPA